MPWLRRMVTELSLVSEKSSSGGGAMTFSVTPPGDAAYRWYSRVREEGGEHRRHEVQRAALVNLTTPVAPGTLGRQRMHGVMTSTLVPSGTLGRGASGSAGGSLSKLGRYTPGSKMPLRRILPSWIGTALMEAAVDLADNWLGLTRIELEVYTDNWAGIALYEKFGFEIEGTHRRFAFRDGEYVDAYSMARLK